VEQQDTEVFETFNTTSLLGNTPFEQINTQQYSSPTLTKHWFHLGPVGPEFGNWIELDLSQEYWSGDTSSLQRPASLQLFLESLPRRVQRDAIRAMRGTELRSELYALDGTSLQSRPYTVNETLPGFLQVLSLVDAAQNTTTILADVVQTYPGERIVSLSTMQIFFPAGLAQRGSQWERGTEPMTSISVTGNYDSYGQVLSNASIGVPRYGDWRGGGGNTDPYLGTMTLSNFIYVDTINQYMIRPLFGKGWDITGSSGTAAVSYLNAALAQLSGTVTFPLISHVISYYDGDHTVVFQGLPYGQIGLYGAHVRDESLAITNDIISAAYATTPPCFAGTGTPDWSAYPSGFTGALQADSLGYSYYTGTDGGKHVEGYYVTPGAKQFDFQVSTPVNPRGLMIASADAFEDQTTVAYDTYQLMPLTVTDSVGMVTVAAYDYRMMQPNLITDPNENIKEVAYSPLGLMYKTAVEGKATGSPQGDNLANPTTLITYDFFNFINNGQPVWVQTAMREQHYYPTETNSPYIIKCDYSDGFGRLIQTRSQAEDTLFGIDISTTPYGTGSSGLPADQTAPNADAMGSIRTSTELNVVVSGWQVYNNKGKVVEKFEPFFDLGFDFVEPGLTPFGQKIQMFYDPRGVLIRTLQPDGTQEKLVLGIPYVNTNPDVYAPTPWVSAAYDANDLDSTLLAYGTPKFNYLDALGRTIMTDEQNVYHDYIGSSGTVTQDIAIEYQFDVRGNLIRMKDALLRYCPQNDMYGNPVYNIYDLHNKPLRTYNLDSGVSQALHDAMDRSVMAINANGAVALSAYDQLGRVIGMWAKDNNISGTLYGRRHLIKYGDSAGLTNPQNENLKGKVYQFYDEAGLVETDSYDFKGNPLSSTRNIITPESFVGSVSETGTDWYITPFLVDWDAVVPPPIDTADYTTQNSYDALNRITAMIYPTANSDTSPTTRTFLTTYNNAGALESVVLEEDVSGAITNTTYVERITYNARGQRLLISMGNGIMTRYVYDNRNFRLLRMKSEDYIINPMPPPNEVDYEPQSGTTIQDFAYIYDSLGNIMNISDQTPGGAVGGGNGLTRVFDYDALYRILKGTGRENLITSGPPYSISPFADNTRSDIAGNTTGYKQYYQYDAMGNILQLDHNSDTISGADYTRTFTYGSIGTNNRLTNGNVWSIDYGFSYDSCGNQTLQNTDSNMQWDFADRMKCFFIRTSTLAEPSKYAQYAYDASGQRVVKVVRTMGGGYSVRVYIGGVFEEYYKYDSSHTFLGYQDEIMIMDNERKVASKLIGTSFGSDVMGIKYIYPDQIGSSNVQCNGSGGLINREEYYPFGETSFGSYGRKRYRFCGKERDWESGMYYYGARYYLAWTCRFVSVDPLVEEYTWSSYVYAGNNPIMLKDINGEGPGPKPGNHEGKIPFSNPLPRLWRGFKSWIHGIGQSISKLFKKNDHGHNGDHKDPKGKSPEQQHPHGDPPKEHMHHIEIPMPEANLTITIQNHSPIKLNADFKPTKGGGGGGTKTKQTTPQTSKSGGTKATAKPPTKNSGTTIKTTPGTQNKITPQPDVKDYYKELGMNLKDITIENLPNGMEIVKGINDIFSLGIALQAFGEAASQGKSPVGVFPFIGFVSGIFQNQVDSVQIGIFFKFLQNGYDYISNVLKNDKGPNSFSNLLDLHWAYLTEADMLNLSQGKGKLDDFGFQKSGATYAVLYSAKYNNAVLAVYKLTK